MPKPPLTGEVASSEAKMTERLYRAAPALFRSLERRPLSNLSVSLPLDSRSPFGTCVPPPPAGGVFPNRGALGKEVSFSMKPIWFCWKTSRNAKASPTRGGGIERSEDVGEVSSPQKQIPHTGRLRCGGAGMESGNVFKRFCHRRQRCGSCHRRCRCTAPDRGRCAPRPPHRWGRGLQWQKPCSGSRCRPCR